IFSAGFKIELGVGLSIVSVLSGLSVVDNLRNNSADFDVARQQVCFAMQNQPIWMTVASFLLFSGPTANLVRAGTFVSPKIFSTEKYLYIAIGYLFLTTLCSASNALRTNIITGYQSALRATHTANIIVLMCITYFSIAMTTALICRATYVFFHHASSNLQNNAQPVDDDTREDRFLSNLN
ncbi:MAG: hypothetical protein ACD_45C00480G0001, partial [uncultured bacterium]